MFIMGGSRFFAELEQERIVCISGALGTGKTLLAHEIALPYIRQGYRFVTNTSSAWAHDWRKLQPVNEFGQMKIIADVDEGGLYVRTAKTASKLASFARKLDAYLIFSGKKLPHDDLQSLRIYLWFDFYKNFALPFKVFRYDVKVDTTKNYHGYVWQTAWQGFYGVYSTLDPGDYPEEILKAFEVYTETLFRRYNRKYQVGDLTTEGDIVELADVQSDISRTSNEVRETLSVLERKTKRR